MNVIKIAKKALHLSSNESSFERFSLVYNHTNEDLTGMMSGLIKPGSKVLTVAASGEHYLTSVLYGAKETDIFDINQLTYYFTYLKIASLKVLELDEYVNFFKIDNYLLNKNTYNKVRKCLEGDVKIFFDYLILYSNTKNYSSLFHSTFFTWKEEELEKYVPFLQIGNYKKLQSILESKPYPNFYRGDVYKVIPKLEDCYDVILFSNISSYQDQGEWKDFILNVASKKVFEGGIIQSDYAYTCYELINNYDSNFNLGFLPSNNCYIYYKKNSK